MFIGHITL